MDNLDSSDNNVKISDSAYSTSCSNSQSRRSHSSKSTHSGSNSSGSSGYGGKPSTSGSSNNFGQSVKKDKESKKKKLLQTETVPDVVAEAEIRPPDPIQTHPDFIAPVDETLNVSGIQSSTPALLEKGAESMDISTSDRNSVKDETVTYIVPQSSSSTNIANSISNSLTCSDGFSCVISMNDGVVMYATSTLTSNLGFPEHMWIGRSFIEFVHPRDRSTFASQITNGLAVPKIVNGTLEKAQSQPNSPPTIVCRIRRYRGLTTGFCVKEKTFTFIPFLLKLSFKNINNDEGNNVYLVVQAKPFFSAFKTSNEKLMKPYPFVMRHAANGRIEYVGHESVPYLGFLPQDLAGKDALEMYHTDDLIYLRQVYETIVKEGGFPRSKPYRMITHNGDYVKLETKWSSFINPWSKKLEFVIGEHHIVEGPANPDVFQMSEPEKVKAPEEELKKAAALRENIIRIMNEVLTKPAEFAKQQMSKRCQDLAVYIESLLEETPKIDEELRLEIQDHDTSYFERDSVMLGGISPHHEYTDSKSSTETPLSYNQLNYNETLQRYFDSHQSYMSEEYNTAANENTLALKHSSHDTNEQCLSPLGQVSAGSSGHASFGEPNASGFVKNKTNDRSPIPRLTESLLTKHNVEMEKYLMNTHRVTSLNGKGDRDKATNVTRKKKKEHLARCNASYQPTSTVATLSEGTQPKGVKRTSRPGESESSAQKHHCPSMRWSRPRKTGPNNNELPLATAITNTPAQTANPYPASTMNNMNTFILGVGIPQQMPLMSPLPALASVPSMPGMPGMFPIYYAPTAPPYLSASANDNPSTSSTNFSAPPLPCMMYGQHVYGSPIMYAPVNPQPQCTVTQENLMAQSIQYINFFEPITTSIDKKIAKKMMTRKGPSTKEDSITNNEESIEKTDGESSYSSLYSSFFKTESGSAEESGDAKFDVNRKNKRPLDPDVYYMPCANKVSRRKIEPPWLEQVSVTSELIYKYQVLTKNVDEVLTADKMKMGNLEQPSLVNEQLGQLYLDMQLEGVTARLTLEEGITSSSSSGEENPSKKISRAKIQRRKREYSKLVMIYEEDAPLPPPSSDENEETATSVK